MGRRVETRQVRNERRDEDLRSLRHLVAPANCESGRVRGAEKEHRVVRPSVRRVAISKGVPPRRRLRRRR